MNLKNKYEKNTLANKAPVIACLSIVLGLLGCQQEGTAEKAGQKIDRAAENAQQKIEQTTEKAAQKIEGTKESLIDKAQSAGEYIDDSVITTKVKAAILNDPILNMSHVEVTTVNGVVKLSGTVDSEPVIGRAMELASSQKNVKSVQINLLVNATPPSK